MKHVIKVSQVDSRKKELSSLYNDHLKRRRYSRRTIKNYAFHPGRFPECTGNRPPNADAIVRYMNHLTGDKEVSESKGKKDRQVPFSAGLEELLTIYLQEYHPACRLFAGQKGGKYSVISIQTLFHRACVKAGIQKPAKVHSLRHFMQPTFWSRVPIFALSRSLSAAAARPRRFTPTFRPAPSQGSEVRPTTWRFPDGLPYNCWIQGDIRKRRGKRMAGGEVIRNNTRRIYTHVCV